MSERAFVFVWLATLLWAAPSFAQWPQFRGPDGQGHSDERDLPVDWSETTNVMWKSAMPGLGWSSPVVAAGRVWLTTAVEVGRGGDVSLRVLAFDQATGRQSLDVEVFRLRRVREINPKNSFASP